MRNSESKVQKDLNNKNAYIDASGTAFQKELALYERFFDKVTKQAKTHRQITLNNLNAVEERLSALRDEATKLKDGIFFHEETVIVDRQEIIGETEAKVHQNNVLLLDNDRFQGNEILSTIDYLNKALIQVRMDFFDAFKNRYLQDVLNTELFFDFYTEKSQSFQSILDRHQEEIMDLFLLLNDEIKNMDDAIMSIINKKNATTSSIERFFNQEMKHFVDNQLMFSPVTDPTSIDIQALVSDKVIQFNAFRKHLDAQTETVIAYMTHGFEDLHQNVLSRIFNNKTNIVDRELAFFSSPETMLKDLELKIVSLDETNNPHERDSLVQTYLKLKDFEKFQRSCQEKTARILKKQRKFKNRIALDYKLEANRLENELERTLLLYRQLMDYDTFLAQIIGDDSSKIIKDELNFLSLLAMNKEHKTNINFDIESQNIKGRINEVEMELIYKVKKQLLLQEVELLDTLKDSQIFLIDRKYHYYQDKRAIEQEKHLIDRLETAMNYHLEYMHLTANINRKWNSEILAVLIHDIRQEETHNIHVVEAASKVKLALKEYDIKALHFKTLYENELNYLVMQFSRIESETAIHNDFILTTYENQMRFAKEQIELANSEYRLRVEAVMRAVDEERTYLEEVYTNTLHKYESRRQLLEDHYQANLYHNNHLISETTDQKIHKILNREIEKYRKQYLAEKEKIESEIENDNTLQQTRHRLRDLDSHLEDAIDDAETIRDDTIREMNEQYLYAKERYEVLKPYLEQKVNILDPTFYNTLESINKRYRYKMKVAEIELDHASKDFLESYLNVYFTAQPEPSMLEMKTRIEDLTKQRQSASDKYSEKMQALEAAYQAEIVDYQRDLDNVRADITSLKNQIVQKRNMTMQGFITELDLIDQQYLVDKKAHQEKHTQTIHKLTMEYQETLKANRKFRNDLKLEFEGLLKSYHPYVKVLKKNPDIRDLIHSIDRQSRRKLRQDQKRIMKQHKLHPPI